MLPYFLGIQAQLDLGAGSPEAALPLLEEARDRIERTGERSFEAAILRFEGEILAMFHRVTDAKARFWEVRAALSLARCTDDPSATLFVSYNERRVSSRCSKPEAEFRENQQLVAVDVVE